MICIGQVRKKKHRREANLLVQSTQLGGKSWKQIPNSCLEASTSRPLKGQPQTRSQDTWVLLPATLLSTWSGQDLCHPAAATKVYSSMRWRRVSRRAAPRNLEELGPWLREGAGLENTVPQESCLILSKFHPCSLLGGSQRASAGE